MRANLSHLSQAIYLLLNRSENIRLCLFRRLGFYPRRFSPPSFSPLLPTSPTPTSPSPLSPLPPLIYPDGPFGLFLHYHPSEHSAMSSRVNSKQASKIGVTCERWIPTPNYEKPYDKYARKRITSFVVDGELKEHGFPG